MASNGGGEMTSLAFFCLLLMGSIMSINSNVIRRREIAATLQQIDGNQTKPTTTMATLKLYASQNESGLMAIKTTKLVPQEAAIESPFPTIADDQTKKTRLHLINEARETEKNFAEISMAMEDKKHLKSHPIELPASTTPPTALNAIATGEQSKAQQKSIQIIVDKSKDTPPTTKVPFVITTTITTTTRTPPTLPPTTLPTMSTIEIVSTNDSLLQDKPKLSLEENASNDLQLSSKPKQPKFLNDNSTNSNRLNIPNTADVWTLAGMKTVSPRSNDSKFDGAPKPSADDSVIQLRPVKEKTLTDWTQIVQMGVDKSIGNALTDDQHQHQDHSPFDGDQESLPSTTIAAVLHAIDNVTSSSASISSILKPNESTNPTSPATTIGDNDATEFLSPNDNGEKSTIASNNNNNNTQSLDEEKTHTQRADGIEEKAIVNEEHTETSTSSSQTQQEHESTTTTETTTTTTTMTMTMKLMTAISSPATASVSTTESILEKRIDDFESEKPNKDVKGTADEFATTIITTTTATNRSTLNLATISDEIVNSTTTTIATKTTTTTSAPDIHQIGTAKSNLETTTKHEEQSRGGETVTIESKTTTTPTPIVQSLNSSAIVNQTLTQENDQKEESGGKEEENISDKDLVAATTDSLLSAQPTSTLTSTLISISTPPPPTAAATTTTTTASTIEEVEAETTIIPIETKDIETTPKIVEVAAVAKDTTLIGPTTTTNTATATTATTTTKTTATASPFDFNETTVASDGITTIQTLDIPTARTEQRQELTTSIVETNTATATRAPSQAAMSNATILPVNESTNSESTFTNFIDDSTTTTTTSTSTSTTAAPDSTISPTTIEVSTTIVSVDTTHTEEFETTPTIAEETPTETKTTTTDLLNADVSSSTFASNTNIDFTTSELPQEIAQNSSEMVPVAVPTTTATATATTPSSASTTTLSALTFPAGMGILHPKSTPDSPETDVNVVIAISVSVIGVIALVLLVAFLYLMRKRQKATSYGQRCRPVSLDAYSLDNVSVLGSVRRKVALRASKRTYGNAAFDDPSLRHNVIQSAAELAKFVERRSSIFEEFRDIPQIIARPEEIPEGCENKNRYANVIPLPETRVILQRRNDDDTSEYINANYVRGPKDAPNYYIACQAPLESTVQDFWRMIWEQQSRVIIQATDLIENGVEKCAEYLPPSVTLDNHTTFGDFQVLLKNREVKDKYAISTIMLKNTIANTSREITHYWYKWPEIGVPSEEAPIIAMLLEARSSLKSYALEVTNELKEKSNANSMPTEGANGEDKALTTSVNGAGSSRREINGNVTEKAKNISRNQGPLTIHCSPGTGRTGTIIACDIAIRSLESTKSLDIPQILYYIRRGRASSVQTKEQYEFIYKVSNVYAMKITNVPSDN